MTDERQIAERSTNLNQISTKRGFPVYRTNPSVPSANALPTRNKRFHVPGGKASMIVDNTTGELKGGGRMGFWRKEDVERCIGMRNRLRRASTGPGGDYRLSDCQSAHALPNFLDGLQRVFRLVQSSCRTDEFQGGCNRSKSIV